MGFRMRLIVAVVLLIAVAFSLGGAVLMYTSFQITLKGEIDGALESFQNVFGTLGLFSAANKNMEPKDLGNILTQMTDTNLSSWQAVVLRVSGETAYSRNQELLAESFADEDNQCTYVQTEDARGNGLLVEGKMKVNGQQLQMQGRFDLSGVYQLHYTQQRLYVIIYIAVLIFGILTATLLSYTLTGKLRKLTSAVKKISGGELSTRSNIRSEDEFGQLSRDFDAMADSLQQMVGKLEDNIQRQETFMGDVAHELKTPMTSIIGFADLLRQGNLDENSRIIAAQCIYKEGHRLERLSFKLLDLLLLKKDEMVMKRINLQSLAEDIQKALGPGLEQKGIRLVIGCARGTGTMEPDLVKSLLYNLIDNASKAIESEGVITLKLEQTDSGCLLQVTDNGRGMEKDQLSKITEAFYRVDKARSRAQGGAGLGLALCKKIVELHHGEIRFDSVPGQGTIVRVILGGEEVAENAQT